MGDTGADLGKRIDLTARLERAHRYVEDTLDAYKAALEQRDALIRQAVDEGMTTNAAARAAGVSQSRVMGVLAAS